MKRIWLAALALAMAVALTAAAQVQTEKPPIEPGAKPAQVVRVKIHGKALEGNLEGNAVDREALVILPPSYAKETARRYPVVYALHGYYIGAAQWSGEIRVPQTIEAAFARGAREMIVVLPDAKTRHAGSLYSSSVTTGDFEQFIVRDVVSYVDAHYRTLRGRRSRGLVGHSMGGYGATRLGMKHADVFGSLYIMSPCCLAPRTVSTETARALEAVKTPQDAAKLGFPARARLATAAAWSPNPNEPPLYLDLPTQGGKLQPEVLAKWTANAPLVFLDQYVTNLRRYDGISIDVGDEDRLRAETTALHQALDRYGISHGFEVYAGTHTSRVAFRFQNHVMPFFDAHLCFQLSCS